MKEQYEERIDEWWMQGWNWDMMEMDRSMDE